MIYGIPAGEAAANAADIEVNGRQYTLSGCVGAAPVRGYYLEGNEANDTGEPQGFLVHQPAGAVTNPHFHETNQFQVFVRGKARFGKQEVAPLTVQYANGHSPYGPIVAGDEGIEYFTLRARWDPGAKYMPGARDRLIKGNQRQRIAAGIPTEAPEDLARRFGVDFETVMNGEADGLAAWIGRFGRDGSAAVPTMTSSGGQYWIVTGGELLLGGVAYPRLSCLFATADEPSVTFTAGADGLEILVLQFPEKNRVGLAADAA